MFILNNETISTDLPGGTTVLDFVRYRRNLKGTKIGCREGDCGACTVMVGEIVGDRVRYRTQTSCLMPLANAAGKHIVTVEGINPEDGQLTPVQAALADRSATQCGFCTVGFVMSLTAFCLEGGTGTPEDAVSAVDGNICRCTGYKSIERASHDLCRVGSDAVPAYFAGIRERLAALAETLPARSASGGRFVSGGTDLYVQRPEEMAASEAVPLFDAAELRFIREDDRFVEIGASTVVTDLMESDIFRRIFPDLQRHLKLVSSTPIRNMATIAGNFVNASPIGDMTVWFLALDAEIELRRDGGDARRAKLRDFYLGYKTLAKADDEYVSSVRFGKAFSHFNFEKVCKRTFLDIASVNSAIALTVADGRIEAAHVAVGGVAPVPLYLERTSRHLAGRDLSPATVESAAEVLRSEISPISDVRGSADYKRLLARQLFRAHFDELYGI